MAGEDQRGFAIEPQLVKQLVRSLWNFDAAALGMRLVMVPDLIDVGELRGEAAEIVPHAGEDFFDFFR